MSQREAENLLREYGEMYRVAEDVAQWIKKVLLSDMKNPTARDLLEANIIREQILHRTQDAILHPDADEGSTTRFLPGTDRLFFMRNELEKVLREDPTIDNFEMAQFILSKYLTDNVVSGERLSLSEQVISDGFARLYNNREGFSLRAFEGKTNDRLRSNIAVVTASEEMPPQEATGDPKQLNIFRIGAGDGGDAHVWAALGYRVTGIDISTRMVAESKARSQQFADAYLNGTDDYSVRSVKEALAATDKDTNEEAIGKIPINIDIRVGNFFDYGADNYRSDFGERQPDIITIMWHTLGFAGDLERMQQVLKNAYDIIRPGGRIFIEIPDRNFGGYARAIRDFHESHPDLPFGTIKDAPSRSADSPTEQDESLATWRYFPQNSEVETVLAAVGFDIDVAVPKSYFVRVEARAGTGAKLLIKEKLFIAEKPLDPTRRQKLLDYAQSRFGHEPGNDDQAEIERARAQIKAA